MALIENPAPAAQLSPAQLSLTLSDSHRSEIQRGRPGWDGPIEYLAVVGGDHREIFARKSFCANETERLATWIHTMHGLGCEIMAPLPGTVILKGPAA